MRTTASQHKTLGEAKFISKSTESRKNNLTKNSNSTKEASKGKNTFKNPLKCKSTLTNKLKSLI